MGMELEMGTGDRVNLAEDIYPGKCVHIIDLGTQTHPKYGKKRRIAIGFYISGAVDEQGNELDNVIKYRQLAAKITKKTDLGKLLKKWLGIEVEPGERFDLDELLNQDGMIDIVHSDEDDDGNVWDNIDRVTRSKEKVKLPKDIEVFSLYLDEKNFDEELYELVPDFLKDKIEESPEYRKLGMGSKKRKPVDDDDDEDDKPKRRRKPVDDEDDEDDKPKRRRKPVKDEEEEEDDDKPKRRKKPADEEEEEEEDDKPRRRRKPVDEEEEEEEEEEDDKPKRRRKPVKDEEEEEDDKPRRRRR